jgi:hypothetical protein
MANGKAYSKSFTPLRSTRYLWKRNHVHEANLALGSKTNVYVRNYTIEKEIPH